MKGTILIIIFLALLAATVSAADSQPALPYYDWGACPFEGCIYREWIAKTKVHVYKDRDPSSPVVFALDSNENVNALTGVVITTKLGKIEILEPITLDGDKPISLKLGDILFTLHYLGEGYVLVWFKGELHQIDTIAETPRNNHPLRVLADPETEWWVKIKNSKGIIGWTKDTDAFSNKDQFE